MRNDDIGAHFCHVPGFLRRTHIDNGEKIHATRQPNHIDFLLHAHPSLLENLPELSIHYRMSRKVIHPAETHLLNLTEKMPHPPPGVAPMHSTDNRHLFYDRENLELSDLHRDCIGVPIGHEPCRRAMASHSKTTRIINDDKIRSPFLNKLGTNPRSGTCCNNGFSPPQSIPQALDHFFPRVGISFSSPRVWHRLKTSLLPST